MRELGTTSQLVDERRQAMLGERCGPRTDSASVGRLRTEGDGGSLPRRFGQCAARAASDALVCGVPLNADGYVLSEEPGQATPLLPGQLSSRWRSACERVAGQRPVARAEWRARGAQVRFHDLRHFSVTSLLAAGVPIPNVARRHGHANATVTLAVYAHAVEAVDETAATIMGDVAGRLRALAQTETQHGG